MCDRLFAGGPPLEGGGPRRNGVGSGAFVLALHDVPAGVELATGADERTFDEACLALEAEAAVPGCRVARAEDDGAAQFVREERAKWMRRIEPEVVRECRLRHRVKIAVDLDRVARTHELLLQLDDV